MSTTDTDQDQDFIAAPSPTEQIVAPSPTEQAVARAVRYAVTQRPTRSFIVII